MTICTAYQQKMQCLWFPLWPKNQPKRNPQTSVIPLANSTVPAFLFGNSMTCHFKRSLHFLVEALIIISHTVSHFYLQHAPCLETFMYGSSNTSLFHVTHLLILVASMHTHKSLHLSCFSFTRNSVTVHWQTNVTDSHIFLLYTAGTLEEAHAPNMYSYKRDCLLTAEPCVQKIAQNIVTVIHLLMSFIVIITLADLWFKYRYTLQCM